MCLISALPKGTVKHGEHVESFIRSGASCNGHGSGFMYKREGTKEVCISKGYFKSSIVRNIDTMIEDYNKLNLGINDEVVFHHRIGTQGATDDLNTHPFFISKDVDIVTTVEGSRPQTALAHNGIFSSFSEWELDNYSDTVGFARFMSEPGLLSFLKNNPKVFAKKVSGINSNRLAFIFPDRSMVLIGEFMTQDVDIDGIKSTYYHSNSGYCRHVTNVGGIEDEDYTSRFGRHTISSKSHSHYPPNHFNKKHIKFNKQPIIKTCSDIEESQLTEIKELGYYSYKLNGKDLLINSVNFRNFYLKVKESSKFYNNIRKGYIYEIDSLDEDKFFRVKKKDSDMYFRYSYESIHSEFDIIPKEQVKNVYRDYLYLDVVYSKPSKKFLKAIYNKIVGKNKNDYTSINIKGANNLYVLAFKEYFNQNKDLVLGSKSGHPLLEQNLEITEGDSVTNKKIKLISYSSDVEVNQELV